MRPCWNCRQPATHTLAREGSITLIACDNCTRIDRAQAESQGWTITRDEPKSTGHEWTGSVPQSAVRAEVSRVGGGTVGERYCGPWEGKFYDTSTGVTVEWGGEEDFATPRPVTHAEAAEAAFYALIPAM